MLVHPTSDRNGLSHRVDLTLRALADDGGDGDGDAVSALCRPGSGRLYDTQ